MQERVGAPRSVSEAWVDTHRGGFDLLAGELDGAIAALVQVVLLPTCRIRPPAAVAQEWMPLRTPLLLSSMLRQDWSSAALLARLC